MVAFYSVVKVLLSNKGRLYPQALCAYLSRSRISGRLFVLCLGTVIASLEQEQTKSRDVYCVSTFGIAVHVSVCAPSSGAKDNG